MTVYELAQTDIGNIKLGAKGGSGFVFCGKSNALDIEKLNKQIIDKNEKTLAAAHDRYRIVRAKSASFNEYVNKNEDKRCTVEGYRLFLDDHFKKVKTVHKTLRTCIDRVENYTDLSGRKIEESYQSIDEKDTIIVLYEGSEVGEAWTTKEYINGVIDTAYI